MARVSTILCAADPAGSPAAVERLAAAADERDADAITVVGDLSQGGNPEDRHIAVAGMGGEVADDPLSEREERERLRYPRSEAEPVAAR
jgi:Icc-related predicted phosphoesterase